MKLNNSQHLKWGIAMTEYLIVVALVAIGAILVISQFGQRGEDVCSRTVAV